MLPLMEKFCYVAPRRSIRKPLLTATGDIFAGDSTMKNEFDTDFIDKWNKLALIKCREQRALCGEGEEYFQKAKNVIIKTETDLLKKPGHLFLFMQLAP